MAAHTKALRRSRLQIFAGQAQTAKRNELDLPATPSGARVESEAPSRTNVRVIVRTNKQMTERRTSIIIRDSWPDHRLTGKGGLSINIHDDVVNKLIATPVGAKNVQKRPLSTAGYGG